MDLGRVMGISNTHYVVVQGVGDKERTIFFDEGGRSVVELIELIKEWVNEGPVILLFDDNEFVIDGVDGGVKVTAATAAPAKRDSDFEDPLLAIVKTIVASGTILDIEGADDEIVEIIARQMTAALERGEKVSPDKDLPSGLNTSLKLTGRRRRKLTITIEGL